MNQINININLKKGINNIWFIKLNLENWILKSLKKSKKNIKKERGKNYDRFKNDWKESRRTG